MPVYQVPQFLDSGDKILGPLNVRQFAYALAGFLLAFFTFTIVNAIIPGLGLFAFIPAIPIAGLAAYLALGTYNGRPSEVYVLKFILYTKKPRNLIFIRKPNLEDLEARLRVLSTEGITNEWNRRLAEKQQTGGNSFESQSKTDKIKRIKDLGLNLDKAGMLNITNIEKYDDLYKKDIPQPQGLARQYSTNRISNLILTKRENQNKKSNH